MDLSTDTTLLVDISDALSERDKVKFTVHTKVGIAIEDLCSGSHKGWYMYKYSRPLQWML